MTSEHEITLSGPFDVTDSLGRLCRIDSIRIFDEGYGLINVYVNLALTDDEEQLHEDPAVIRQILTRLHSLGYAGPDFGPGADDLQDSHLIVLEAPEAFQGFAMAKGWKNLADDYSDTKAWEVDAMNDSDAAWATYAALMQRLHI